MRHMRKAVAMIHLPLTAKRFTEYKGTESDNRDLMQRLDAQSVKEAFWTDHAIDRAQEMVDAGFDFGHIKAALDQPASVTWSSKHEQPNAQHGEVSVAVMSDRWGRAIVVTVLPHGDEAWDKFYAACPGSHGRQKR